MLKSVAVEEPGTFDASGMAALGTVLSGVKAGIAVFDGDLRLITCNSLYRDLCGYDRSEAAPGAAMTDLIRRTLERQRTPDGAIEAILSQVLRSLRPGSDYSFRFVSPSARTLEVHRRGLPDGCVVETVQEVGDLGETAGQVDHAEHFGRVARQRMMHALDVMADGFALYNADDRLVIYNRKYVELNPHIADLIMPGACFEAMLRKGMERDGYLHDHASAEAFVRWRIEQHRNPGEPYDLQLSDGRWCRVHEKRTDDGGIVGIRSDITELKNREFEILRMSEELRAKNLQFDTALNNMVQGLCMFDAEQRLLVCNRRYLEMYGFSDEVVKPGAMLADIMRYSVSLGNYTQEEADRALAERPDQARSRERGTIKQRLRDGRVIAVLNEPMANGGSIATYQDITELERHEENLRSYTRKLEISNRELQDFAYVASHDLQEPLRKIETFGSRLQSKFSEHLPDDARDYIERMQNASSRMRRLIEDLLSYSRVTTKANPFVAIDLPEVIEGVLSDLQIRLEETGGEVRVGELPRIEADPSQMRQLFQNLIGNALKFSRREAPPVITVSARLEPGVPGEPDDRRCRLVVEDNGIGFDNKYRDQIFTIFQRLHGRTEYEGTGVGLAICRKIVERHGGTIEAEGRPGEGARFIVTLPARQPAQPSQQELP